MISIGIVLALALSLLLAWSTRLHWLTWVATSLTVSDPLQPASAVLILPGSEEIRPFVAASLMKAGYADRVIVPETRANPDVLAGHRLSTGELTRQILIRRGIASEKIVILKGSSDSTMDDALALKRYFAETGPRTIIIVTSAYHSRRARWAFHRVLADHSHNLRFYAAPNGFDTSRWWTSRKGRHAVLSEFLKIPFYVIYHGHGWRWGTVLTFVGGILIFRRCRSTEGPTKDLPNVGVIPPASPDARA